MNWSDVVSTLQSLQSYLIVIGVVLVLTIVATVACLKLDKAKKFMIRCQAWIAALIAIVVVNIICTGPMFTLLSTAVQAIWRQLWQSAGRKYLPYQS